MDNQLQQGDRVRGTFRPKDESTLKPEARKYIGSTMTGEVLWICEDHESFPGQAAIGRLVVEASGRDSTEFAWAPEEDFPDLEVIQE